MQRKILFVVVLLGLGEGTWCSTSADPAAGPPGAIATVRTFNYAQVSKTRLAQTRTTVDATFKSAEIAIQWVDCRVPQGDGAPCLEPLQPGRDLMLRIIDQPHGDRGRRRSMALATSMLDREQHGGALMTVDLFPIRTLAAQTATDFPTLLGRAIAHEIGHLLLGTSEHPREGLMRARWLQDELRGLKPAHWGFSRREAAQMRHGLGLRARGAN